MDGSPAAIVDRFIIDVLNGGRPESAPELIRNDPLQRRLQALRLAFTDLRVTVVRRVAQGPFVALHLAASGTHTGPFQGGSPTGRVWSSTCTGIFEVRDGSIVDFWLTWDLLDILEQLRLVQRAADASA
jgi:predicted ester cyclase